jgi:hypothetical protein
METVLGRNNCNQRFGHGRRRTFHLPLFLRPLPTMVTHTIDHDPTPHTQPTTRTLVSSHRFYALRATLETAEVGHVLIAAPRPHGVCLFGPSPSSPTRNCTARCQYCTSMPSSRTLMRSVGGRVSQDLSTRACSSLGLCYHGPPLRPTLGKFFWRSASRRFCPLPPSPIGHSFE